ncbi:MAG: hypothetical protein P9M15_06895, partial [Candidatus Electryoneaceae bacterium]|nr:hypothetical protein [Candidatus Electryoneaceae bacterium]
MKKHGQQVARATRRIIQLDYQHRNKQIQNKDMLLIAVLLCIVGSSVAQPLDSLWSGTYGEKPWDELNQLILTSDGGFLLVGQIGSYGGGRMSGYVVKTDSIGHEQWSRVYTGDGTSGFYSAVQTDDGGYILMGYCWTSRTKSLDFQLMKTDSTGEPIWSHMYGDFGAEQCFAGIQTADGGYLLAGYTASFGIENDDLYLVKTDARGYKQWSWSYGGTGGERCYAVIQTD